MSHRSGYSRKRSAPSNYFHHRYNPGDSIDYEGYMKRTRKPHMERNLASSGRSNFSASYNQSREALGPRRTSNSYPRSRIYKHSDYKDSARYTKRMRQTKTERYLPSPREKKYDTSYNRSSKPTLPSSRETKYDTSSIWNRNPDSYYTSSSKVNTRVSNPDSDSYYTKNTKVTSYNPTRDSLSHYANNTRVTPHVSNPEHLPTTQATPLPTTQVKTELPPGYAYIPAPVIPAVPSQSSSQPSIDQYQYAYIPDPRLADASIKTFESKQNTEPGHTTQIPTTRGFTTHIPKTQGFTTQIPTQGFTTQIPITPGQIPMTQGQIPMTQESLNDLSTRWPFNRKPCRHWSTKGFCVLGEKCGFSHDETIKGTMTIKSQLPCRHFSNKGFCAMGDRCHFTHHVEPTRASGLTKQIEAAKNVINTMIIPKKDEDYV